MSKIPQGEWNAIAARYAKGESISKIAQTYGCTPPAIHYILKRSKQRLARNAEQRMNGKPEPVVGFVPEARNAPIAETVRTPVGGVQHDDRADEIGPAARVQQAQPWRRGPETAAPSAERHQPASREPAGRRDSAFAAALDQDLHGRAEAAISAFRSSFDAALVESSPGVRHRLRQAASDLMRVAARTTIVLDRLNANLERQPQRVPQHPRAEYQR